MQGLPYSQAVVSQIAKLFLTASDLADVIRRGTGLHVISRKKLHEAAEEHSNLGEALDVWYRIAKKVQWKNITEVRRVFPSADAVGKFTVFNIKGNKFRLIAEINYRTGRIFLRHVLTHAEYTKGAWNK